jgi:putative ABC transport system permease protein
MQTSPVPHNEARLTAFFSGLNGDVRHALRLLRKSPAFTLVTLLTLTLCIGATTAIFSVVYALMLKPLPYPEPERIVEIYNSFPKAGFEKMPSNFIQYWDFKNNAGSFEAIGLWRTAHGMLGEEGSADRINVAAASADFFDVLGIKPVLGRLFTPQDNEPGAEQTIVLTYSFWESRFGRDPAVIDRQVRLDGVNWRVVGVAPRSFETFDAQVKLIRPIGFPADRTNLQARYSCNTPLYARLKAGTTLSRALAEIGTIEKRYYDGSPPPTKQFLDRAGHLIKMGTVHDERVQPLRPSLLLLQGGVVFVMLIGCVNIANLLLARANGRQSEIAIRFALGAGRVAIARQLLIESLLLTLTGAAAGVGLAWAGVKGLNYFAARLLPMVQPFAIDGYVLAFTAVLGVAVGILIGLTPVIHILRSNLVENIHRSSRSSSGSRGVRAISSILVTGQVAAAILLLSGAGLLIHSFANALAVNPGFDPEQLVTGRIALPAGYREGDRLVNFQKQLVQVLHEIPAVSDVALGTGLPFQGGMPVNALTIKDSTLPPDSPQPGAFHQGVSVGYFHAMRIQLVEGRFLTEDDAKTSNSPRAFVVDEKFSQRYLNGTSAVGRRFTFGAPPQKDEDWPVIVGVVRNVPHNGIEDRTNTPFIYYPLQNSRTLGLNFFIRTQRPAGEVIPVIREKLRVMDPSIALFDTRSMEEAIRSSMDVRRLIMQLLVGFAVLALFLSAIGIYGVLAYDVSQRTREIGIRGAIGATRGQLVALIMRQGLIKTGIGVVIGLVAALILSRTMSSLLFEVKPTDPRAYLAVALLLSVVAAIASYLPALIASRIDPNQALRAE